MKKLFIGYWRPSVVLTYLGIICSVTGIIMCYEGNVPINYVMCLLMTAGVCDMFDGTVARKCKRTEGEKEFGIQLDSLADVINFVAFPVSLFMRTGIEYLVSYVVFACFAICAVARLAYFNCQAMAAEDGIKVYTGLPVTVSAAIFPLGYLIRPLMSDMVFGVYYTLLIAVVGILHISNFKLKKPGKTVYAILIALFIMVVTYYVGFYVG